jgi:PAS domain S-box-containing protein
MHWLQDMPIRWKVTLVILLTSTTTLLLACVAFVHYELVTSRQTMVRDLQVLADVLGQNSAAALQFDDQGAGENILLALQAKPHLIAACLYTKDGQRFATYAIRGMHPQFPSQPEVEGSHFISDRLVMFRPIHLDQKVIGTIYLQSNLDEFDDRLRSFTRIATLVVFGAMGVTMVISFWMQQLVSQPILRLANTAQVIRDNNDYSVRAEKQGRNEIGLLTDSFNQMLTQIQTQDGALRRAQNELEQRVRDRTAELTTANATLQVEVAERLRTGEALRESESRFRSLLDGVQDYAIFRLDSGGCVATWNAGAERIKGYTAEEIIGQHFSRFYTPEDLQGGKPGQELNIAITQGRCEVEGLRARKDGSRFWANVVITPLHDTAGNVTGFSKVTRDVTERRKAEEEKQKLTDVLRGRTTELEIANQELEAFSYSVSHDLRAPLRGLDGFSQALLEDYGDKVGSDGKKLLQRIRAGSQRMGQLIDDLLNLSRVSRGELRREPVDLSGLAGNVVDELRTSDPQRDVTLRISEGLKAEGDPRLLRVVLENLLGNAWKYTSRQPHATIEFGLHRDNGHSSFFVRDDGVGFDMQYVDKLFAPFQRLHGMTEFPGTGIGLATVQRVIHRHGGRIWVQAEVNKGATFHFTLS